MGRNPVNSPTPARSLHIIFATTSGHTEYVVDTLTSSIGLRGWEIEKTLAEKASPPDMLRPDGTADTTQGHHWAQQLTSTRSHLVIMSGGFHVGR
jgi:hypothetical protein